jgi:hypothetical protein
MIDRQSDKTVGRTEPIRRQLKGYVHLAFNVCVTPYALLTGVFVSIYVGTETVPANAIGPQSLG